MGCWKKSLEEYDLTSEFLPFEHQIHHASAGGNFYHPVQDLGTPAKHA